MVETAVKQKAIRYIEQLDDEQALRVIAYIETFPKKESGLQNSKTPEERIAAAKAFADLEKMTSSKNADEAKPNEDFNGRKKWLKTFWSKYENLD